MDVLLFVNGCTGQSMVLLLRDIPCVQNLACFNLFCGAFISFVSHFLQLLISYGDTGTKGAQQKRMFLDQQNVRCFFFFTCLAMQLFLSIKKHNGKIHNLFYNNIFKRGMFRTVIYFVNNSCFTLIFYFLFRP